MPTTYKILAQSNPAATTNTDVYTVPALTQTVVSNINVANLAASTATFNIAFRKAGASLANQHYIAYNITVGASDTTSITNGYTLGAGDVITIQGSTATLAFSFYGSEIS